MVQTESRVWSDSGVEPAVGDEVYTGQERPIAEYDNWAMWAVTKDVDSLAEIVNDLELVDSVTKFTFDTEANRTDEANLADPDDDGWIYFEIDTGRLYAASGGTWTRFDDAEENSITSTELATDAVDTTHIQTDAVTADEISADSVGVPELNETAVDDRYVEESGDTMTGDLMVGDGNGQSLKVHNREDGQLYHTNEKLAEPDSSDSYVILLEKYQGGHFNFTHGRFYGMRGPSSNPVHDMWRVTTGTTEPGNHSGTLYSQRAYPDSSTVDLVTCDYNGTTYLAIEYDMSSFHRAHDRGLWFTGLSGSEATEELTVVPYYDNGTDTVLDAEINDSIASFDRTGSHEFDGTVHFRSADARFFGNEATELGAVRIQGGTTVGNSNTAALNSSHTAVGPGATTATDAGADQTAIGSDATVSDREGTAVGVRASVTGSTGAGAFARSAAANGANSLAMGRNATTDGDDSVALGLNASTGKFSSVALGHNATVGGYQAVVAGYDAEAHPDGEKAVVLGRLAYARNPHDIAIGDQAQVHADADDDMSRYSIAIGRRAAAEETGSMALGDQAKATADGAVAIGGDAVSDVPDMLRTNKDVSVDNFIRGRNWFKRSSTEASRDDGADKPNLVAHRGSTDKQAAIQIGNQSDEMVISGRGAFVEFKSGDGAGNFTNIARLENNGDLYITGTVTENAAL